MDKINLQLLAKLLAVKKNMTQKDSEAFLGQFFDAILENIATEKVVKIKGFGTFKLIEVLDRESVNVNTGERIVIPGHSKVSFTPDAAVKDLINKPFSDFPTVIINEGTNIEDMERIDLLQQEPAEEDEQEEIEEEAVEETIPSEAPDVVQKFKQEPLPATEPASLSDTVDSTESVPEPAPESETPTDVSQAISEPAVLAPPEVVVQVRALTFVESCALVVGALVLCVLSYLAGYHKLLCPDWGVKEEPMVSEEIPTTPSVPPVSATHPKPATVLPADSATQSAPTTPNPVAPAIQPPTTDAPEKQAVPSDSLKSSKLQTPQEKKPTLNPNARYKITGTRRMHRVRPGEYLTLIAVREYGSKNFANYIIEHNQFKNPDNIPLNSEIKLPELEEMQ